MFLGVGHKTKKGEKDGKNKVAKDKQKENKLLQRG